MELFKRRLSGTPCGEYTRCSKCTKEGCGWCGDINQGTCQEESLSCNVTLAVENRQCPSVGANVSVEVVLRNVSGLLGAMVAMAIFLNVLNRYQNRRRNKKLKKSIFTLPCYVYPSRERRAAALREARLLLRAPMGSARDIHFEAPSSEEEEDAEDPSTVMTACTICLAAYQDQEVIKVLPCGHDFHSGCLDPWLEVKAECPLCKTPAFGMSRSQDRRRNSRGHHHGHGHSQVHAVTPARGSQRRGRARLEAPSVGAQASSAAGSADAKGEVRLRMSLSPRERVEGFLGLGQRDDGGKADVEVGVVLEGETGVGLEQKAESSREGLVIFASEGGNVEQNSTRNTTAMSGIDGSVDQAGTAAYAFSERPAENDKMYGLDLRAVGRDLLISPRQLAPASEMPLVEVDPGIKKRLNERVKQDDALTCEYDATAEDVQDGAFGIMGEVYANAVSSDRAAVAQPMPGPSPRLVAVA